MVSAGGGQVVGGGLGVGAAGYRVRFDWGPVGAEAVAAGAAVVAVVDVLSFTTTVTVAVERGMAVLPYRWRDDSAAEVARRHGAVLAVGRSRARPGQISLSPASVLASDGVERLVLPSPNGSTIAARLAGTGVTVVGVCLRNATAAAAWVRERVGDRAVAVVAAGERWSDGSLRPAVEDLWGAGAFIDALDRGRRAPEGRGGLAPEGRGDRAPEGRAGLTPEDRGGSASGGRGGMAPEAGAARAAYREVVGRVGGALGECASGRELIGQGFAGDVAVAGQVDASVAVPVLRDGWFVEASSSVSLYDGGSMR
jgi:2-phosphosulfolactate phosphatase